MSIALASSQCSAASGHRGGSGPWPVCATASPGATSSGLSIPPQAAPSSTWRPASRSRSSRWSSPPSPARSAPVPPSRSCSSSTAPAGNPPVCACACLRVPEHVHLLFLPPYSPELQPAEHLWPLTNTALINRHFATIDDLEDAQFARCLALQQRPDLIRSTTRFHWWPQQIHKRLGPRRR